MFKLFLKKRQCLFSSLIEELLWPSKDTLSIEIPIMVPDYALPDGSVTNAIPLEIIFCKRREMKNIINNFPHLKGFVGPIIPKLPINDSSNPNPT